MKAVIVAMAIVLLFSSCYFALKHTKGITGDYHRTWIVDWGLGDTNMFKGRNRPAKHDTTIKIKEKIKSGDSIMKIKNFDTTVRARHSLMGD